MVFYDNRAIRLYAEIREHLKEDVKKGAPIRGDLMAQMLKHMQKANEVCIECAAKLAPYQSPRLQSMEVNKKVTHRFVIQAPQQIEDSNAWLEQINKPLKLIETTPQECE